MIYDRERIVLAVALTKILIKQVSGKSLLISYSNKFRFKPFTRMILRTPRYFNRVINVWKTSYLQSFCKFYNFRLKTGFHLGSPDYAVSALNILVVLFP